MPQIPLNGRNGVVAYATVDEFDVAAVSAFRWYWHRRDNYAVAHDGERTFYMHRLILGLAAGEMADHADNNGLNNSRSNLRRCNKSQNTINSPTRRNSHGLRGVKRSGGRFQARITVDKKRLNLGSFATEAEAALAYAIAAKRFHGEFASLAMSVSP